MWNLPGPGIEPISSALAGGFLTTGPPGKSRTFILKKTSYILNKLKDTQCLNFFFLKAELNIYTQMYVYPLVTQSCRTFCDPMYYSPPGSSVHGIFQARILDWTAISFSGDLPDPEIKPGSPALQADSLLHKLPGKPYTDVCMQTYKYICINIYICIYIYIYIYIYTHI